MFFANIILPGVMRMLERRECLDNFGISERASLRKAWCAVVAIIVIFIVTTVALIYAYMHQTTPAEEDAQLDEFLLKMHEVK